MRRVEEEEEIPKPQKKVELIESMDASFKAWKPPIGVSVHRVISPIKFHSIASIVDVDVDVDDAAAH